MTVHEETVAETGMAPAVRGKAFILRFDVGALRLCAEIVTVKQKTPCGTVFGAAEFDVCNRVVPIVCGNTRRNIGGVPCHPIAFVGVVVYVFHRLCRTAQDINLSILCQVGKIRVDLIDSVIRAVVGDIGKNEIL